MSWGSISPVYPCTSRVKLFLLTFSAIGSFPSAHTSYFPSNGMSHPSLLQEPTRYCHSPSRHPRSLYPEIQVTHMKLWSPILSMAPSLLKLPIVLSRLFPPEFILFPELKAIQPIPPHGQVHILWMQGST